MGIKCVDTTDLMYDILKTMQADMAQMKSDISDLTAYKNRVVGGAVVAGAVFATCFEAIKAFITKA